MIRRSLVIVAGTLLSFAACDSDPVSPRTPRPQLDVQSCDTTLTPSTNSDGTCRTPYQPWF